MIDIEWSVEQAVRRDFASTGLMLDNFDFSNLTVSLKAYYYSAGPSQITPVNVKRESYPNCSRSPMSRTVKVFVTETTTATATLNDQIDFGHTNNAVANLGLPPVVVSGSGGSMASISIAGGGQSPATDSKSRMASDSVSFVVPGCSQVDVMATWSTVTFSGWLTIILEVMGRVKFEARLPGGSRTATVEYPAIQEFTVTGSYSGVTGAGFQFATVERRANCPPDSLCGEVRRTQVGGATKSVQTTPVGGATKNVQTTPVGGASKKPAQKRRQTRGTCYSGVNCQGNILAQNVPLGQCYGLGGKSWRSPDGKCVNSIPLDLHTHLDRFEGLPSYGAGF